MVDPKQNLQLPSHFEQDEVSSLGKVAGGQTIRQYPELKYVAFGQAMH